MFQFKRSYLLLFAFIFTTLTTTAQTNFLQNSSYENWAGNPESPDNWTIENENAFAKSADATDGSFSLELDLNDQISTFNQTTLSSKDVNVAKLQTSTTYTVTFDYKVQQGNTISSTLWVLRDAGSFTIQHETDFIGLNDDGNWHTHTFDFTTDGTDEDYIVELTFRARTAPTNIVRIDNFRILGAAVPDADNDGVPDANDQCPNTAANALAVDGDGCEVVIDQSNILNDPSFEDWSLGGGSNLADWGIIIQAGGWNKNADINDNLQYSVELTTSDSGSYFASIFQSDVQLYKDVPYVISIDYKVVSGTFNELELEFTEGIFADTVEKFTLTNFASGWNTYTATYTPTENQLVDFRIDVSSNEAEGIILLDNSTINATIGGLGPDADNDGVNDSNDNCPNTPNGEAVNENGCSQGQLGTDNDNDGILNDDDNCPNTPAGETVDANGCSQSQLDDDNDGVTNDLDNCPNTPSGASVDANGCAQSQLDDDNDGVTNDNDTCPNTPQGETVNSEGCVDDQTNLPDIPSDGIRIKVTSTSCPTTENGEISISFDKDYAYTVQIQSPSLNATIDDVAGTTGFVSTDLAPDTYEVCITIPDFPDFKQCFTVIVGTPEDLQSGRTIINSAKKEGALVVSGSKHYEVHVNETKMNFTFDDTGVHEITFALEDGANNILVRTDKNCQGEYFETVLLNSVRVFPNPSTEIVTMLGLMNTKNATVTIVDMSGRVLKSYSEDITNTSAEINITDFPEGMYHVRITSDEQVVQSKIVKK